MNLRLVAFLLVVMGGGWRSAAHDIPADITVQMLLKPEGKRLQVLVRVPLKAVRDVEFPEIDGGYLDIDRFAPLLADSAKVWIADFVYVEEGERPLGKPRVAATQLSLESDRSFADYETALAHVRGPRLGNEAHVVWNQVLFDVLLEYPIESERSLFAIRPGVERLGERVVTVVRFVAPGGTVRAFEFTGDPGVVVLDPRWHQAALRFVKLGIEHILSGTDHLLFLFCLVIPLRKFRPLVLVVTAFTVAHSVTLLASAYDVAPGALWFPPLVETLIAASIVYMALENIVGMKSGRRWMVAFGFGLVHGFGFSFALRESLQFAGSHLLTALLAFNVGVELGQVAVLAVMAPLLWVLFRYAVAERMGVILLSALAAHTGWHWMLERWAVLSRYPVPAFDGAFLWRVVVWVAGLAVLAGGMALVVRWLTAGPEQQADEG